MLCAAITESLLSVAYSAGFAWIESIIASDCVIADAIEVRASFSSITRGPSAIFGRAGEIGGTVSDESVEERFDASDMSYKLDMVE